MHLISSLKAYNEQACHWRYNQKDLFWRQVIGYTQRFLPASYAQALCQGIYSIVDYNQPLRRSFKLKYEDSSYFPLAELVGLGFDSAARGVLGAVLWPFHEDCDLTLTDFDRLYNANMEELLRLEHGILHDRQSITGNENQSWRSWCAIS